MLRNAAYASALFGLPANSAALEAPALPGDALFHSDPEAYWTRIRNEQFQLPSSRIFMNAEA